MKYPILILFILTLSSCYKETNRPIITITPSLTTQNNKWVFNLNYSDTINTQGMVRFYWVVSDSNKKQYKYFGSLPLEQPQKSQSYQSGITSFTSYHIDSLIVEPTDYLGKYTLIIVQ